MNTSAHFHFNRLAQPLRHAVLAAALGSSCLLTACDPITPFIVGGAVAGTVISVTDRRTTSAQATDKLLARRVAGAIQNVYGERTHVNINVYNQRILLTGEAPDEATKADVEKIAAAQMDAREVVNELGVQPPSTKGSRANDVFITGKVKAALIDEKTLVANAFLITSERGTVYLMGRVTEREAKVAALITSRVSGVQKVVKAMEIISEEELAEFNKKYGPAEEKSDKPQP
jgi:osmotically-inducible protein OsmY